jgi:flagellar hook assembly protein FlgD
VVPRCIPDTLTREAVLDILDSNDDETAIFCPDCPGSDSQVKIRFNGPHSSRVELRIFDVYGREVATLSDYYILCGSRVYEWDGRDEVNERLPMGLYHVVVTATEVDTGDESQSTAPIVIGRRLK